MRKPLQLAVSLLLACSLLCGFLTTAAAVEYCSCAEEDRIREWNEETEQIICGNCGLEIQIEDSTVYLPVGYGTRITNWARKELVFQSTEWEGNQYPQTFLPATSWTMTNNEEKGETYATEVYRMEGNVPAGATSFSMKDANSTNKFSSIQAYSKSYESGTSLSLNGSITFYFRFGITVNDEENMLYPRTATIYYREEAGGLQKIAQTVYCKNGKANFNTTIDADVTEVAITFTFSSDDTLSTDVFDTNSVGVDMVYSSTLTDYTITGETEVEAQNQANIFLSDIRNSASGILDAIKNIPASLLEGIQSLFIPTEEQMNILRGKWQVFLTNKMGFIYQMFQWVETFFDGIIAGLSGDDTGGFTIPAFPAFEAGGETVQLWSEPLEVDFSENPYVQTVQSLASPFILGVTAYHLWFSMADLMECFFAGKSYRDFSKRRDDA